MAGTEVILLRSTDVGAPTLSGTVGTLLDVLDACLVDGYNSKSIQSITRSGSTATVTFATAHNYAADGLTKVQISGAGQTEYNGIFKISNVTTTTFDITVTGTPATPATGTITSKVAPLGWGRPFTRTANKGVYRSSETTGTRFYLRVVDDGSSTNGARNARLRGYETMTDVDTGTGLFPTDLQVSGGLWFGKSNTLDVTAKSWVLAGDGFEFFLFYTYSSSYPSTYRCFHFGDVASEQASDPYGCLIYGSSAENSAALPETSDNAHFVVSNAATALAGHYLARSFTGIGASIAAGKVGLNYNFGNLQPMGVANMPYPAGNNNGLYIAPIFVIEPSTPLVRATLKGLYAPLHTRPLGHAATYSSPVGLAGRMLYSVTTPYSGSTPGETHVDITGPWR